MRKWIVLLIAVLALCTGCTKHTEDKKDTSSENIASVESSVLSQSGTLVDSSYDGYFLSIFDENPVDAAYKQRLREDAMTLREITTQYIYDWQAEFAFTLQQCAAFMSDEDYAALQQSMIEWETSVNEYKEIKIQLLFSGEAHYGTLFYEECKIDFAEQYREQVKELKYLCFVLETGLDPENFSENLQSLRFCEPGE